MAYGKPKRRLSRKTKRKSAVELKKSGTANMEAISTEPIDHIHDSGPPSLSEEIQNRIGDQLRLLYDQIAEEPVPDHLLEQLKRLEAKE